MTERSVINEAADRIERMEQYFDALQRAEATNPAAIREDASLRGLLQLLEIIAKCGVNMTKIESRPVKDRPGDYRFFIEADCNVGSGEVQEMLSAIKANTLECKLLGAYNRN